MNPFLKVLQIFFDPTIWIGSIILAVLAATAIMLLQKWSGIKENGEQEEE